MTKEFEIKEIPANIDHLTGLHRKKATKAKILDDLTEEPEQYSLVLFDIDHFKAVNDIYRHNQGDAVLKDIGALVQSLDDEIGSYAGLSGRWGGEEFLIALPYATEEDAESLAEKIRRIVEQHPFSEDIEQQITITLGVNYQEVERYDETMIEELVEKADTALSMGKFFGRNRVIKFNNYIRSEADNLSTVRRFYFSAPKGKIPKEDIHSCLSNQEKVVAEMQEHLKVLKDHFDEEDTRIQAHFADKLYRMIRQLPCKEKQELITSMTHYIPKPAYCLSQCSGLPAKAA